MKSETFYVWITLCAEVQADRLVSALVRLGHKVGPLSSSKHLTITKNTYSALLSIMLDTGWTTENADKQTSKHRLMEEVKAALKKLDAGYHSIIVTTNTGADCTWDAGEITIPTQTKTAHERITEE